MKLGSVQIVTLVLPICLSFQTISCEWSNVVQTKSGPLRGQILKTGISGIPFAAFMGIPYAQPSTGQRRFKPPIPVNAWTEVLNVTNKNISCPQISMDWKFSGTEDCLILNVYTPVIDKSRRKKLPVLVWIHGGGFLDGNSNFDDYRPDYFIEKELLMVSVNYRLSVLGFLNVNRPGATGNAGLKDQVLALKWIKMNIKHFGGDRKKVTIFGQSAGGASVSYHILSDMSKGTDQQYKPETFQKGLFQGAISDSGTPLCPYWGFHNNKDSVNMAFVFGKELGIYTSDPDVLLDKLYNVSAEVMATIGRTIALNAFRLTAELSNVAPEEEKFLTSCPRDKYESGKFSKVPQIIGFNSVEALQIVAQLDENAALASNTSGSLRQWFEVGKSFGLNVPESLNVSDEVLLDFGNQLSDLFFVAPIDKTQQYLAKSNGKNPIFYYRFSFTPDPLIIPRYHNLPGAIHIEELYYLFYNFLADVTVKDPIIAKNTEIMVDMWSNFTKFLNPTPDVHTERVWPDSRFLGSNLAVRLEIGSELSIGGRPLDDDAKRFQQRLDKVRDGC